MNAWNHPELGTFKFTDPGWVGQCVLPAFKVFKFRMFGRNAGRSKVEITFEAPSDEAFPSKRAVAAALRVVKNQKSLVDRLKNALWNDLNGRGPDSGIWWHGDLRTVREAIAGAFRDRRPGPFGATDDLDYLLGSPSLSICESAPYYDKPCAVICLEAAFEIEHGVGVLTDGKRILGTGYQIGVHPFGVDRRRRQKEWIRALRQSGLVSD